MVQTLGVFHHRLVRRITGNFMKQRSYGVCQYPPIEEALREVGIKKLEEYIKRSQNALAQFITTQPIMDLCLEA